MKNVVTLFLLCLIGAGCTAESGDAALAVAPRQSEYRFLHYLLDGFDRDEYLNTILP